MTSLMQIAMANAVVAVPLAALVWGISRMVRRPAFTHAVWIVVLLKFITPPFFELPFSVSIPLATNATEPQIALPLDTDDVAEPVELSPSADLAEVSPTSNQRVDSEASNSGSGQGIS